MTITHLPLPGLESFAPLPPPAEVDDMLRALNPVASYVLAEPDDTIRHALIVALTGWLADVADQSAPLNPCPTCHVNPVHAHGVCWSCGVA